MELSCNWIPTRVVSPRRPLKEDLTLRCHRGQTGNTKSQLANKIKKHGSQGMEMWQAHWFSASPPFPSLSPSLPPSHPPFSPYMPHLVHLTLLPAQHCQHVWLCVVFRPDLYLTQYWQINVNYDQRKLGLLFSKMSLWFVWCCYKMLPIIEASHCQ